MVLTWHFHAREFFFLTHSFLHALFAEMGSPVRLPLALRNFPSIYGREPLPFVYGEGDVNLNREFVRGYPLSGYGCFTVPALDAHAYPSKWVEEWSTELAVFHGKGILKPEFHLNKCVHHKDNMDIGPEGVRIKTQIDTLLHSMMWETPSGQFIAGVDFRHYATVSTDNRFMFWLCDCLHRLEVRLKEVGVYEAVWASRYMQQLDGELMKALVARWSPTINTIFTCYGELGISLWDVYRISGLPIVREMYDEFFPSNRLILDKTHPSSLRSLFEYGLV